MTGRPHRPPRTVGWPCPAPRTMPSHCVTSNKNVNKKRDIEVGKAVKGWDGKRVRAIVQCFHCGKSRCIYTATDDLYSSAMLALQQKIESVSCRFSCGGLLFDDSHHLSKVILQRKSLTCELPIEKGYYNNKDRRLKLKQICYHCGESGSTCFVFGLEQLREKHMTDGYNCYPICADCSESGKNAVKQGKQDKMRARREREARAKVVKEARERANEAGERAGSAMGSML